MTTQPPITSHSNTPWRQSGIPVEVWGEVFLKVIAHTKLKAADQVHVFCLACKEWREAALSTPRLWTDLKVGIGAQTTFSKLCTWLARSRTLPKRVTLIDSRGTSQTPASAYGEVERFLVEGPVLEKLALQADSMHSFQDIIDGIESLSLPTRDRAWDSLRSFALHICDWNDPEEGPYRRHTSFLHFPPSLTHLSLTLPWYLSFTGEEPDFPPSISLPNLLHLYIECDWPATWILKTLSSCRTIQTLTLRIGTRMSLAGLLPNTNRQRCALPNLRTLRLRSEDWLYTYTDILRPLVLPSLTHLDISRENGYDAPEDESHWAPVERYGDNIQTSSQRSGSFVNLRHVRLHFPKERGGTVDLAPILRRLPLTTHLTIDDTNFEPTLFQQGSQLLPQLQFLELIGRQPAFDYVSLAQFCEERSSMQPGFTVSRTLISSADVDDGWDIHA